MEGSVSANFSASSMVVVESSGYPLASSAIAILTIAWFLDGLSKGVFRERLKVAHASSRSFRALLRLDDSAIAHNIFIRSTR
jgi:AmiR/NasT family two-component response regulator